MRKKIQHDLVLLFSAVLMILGLTILPAGAAEIRLYDEGKVLSPSEVTECEDRLRQASDHTGMNIAVIIGVQERSDITIKSTCDETYKQLYGVKADGLCYYMDLKGYSPCDHISTFGRGNFYYCNESPDRIDGIFSNLDSYLYPVGMENVSGALKCFAEQVEYYYDAGVPEHYYVYDDEERMYYYMDGDEMIPSVDKPFRNPVTIYMFLAAGMIIGALAALCTYFGVRNAYKFKFELSPTTYVNRKNVDYREQYDNFTHTSTSRVHIESSGSRSGGGHSGGGHMSGGIGGGSHHR